METILTGGGVAYASHKMHSKFDPVLHIRGDGLVAYARGPIGNEVTEFAYFVAVISQGRVIGRGISEHFSGKADTWRTHVTPDFHRFRAGSAFAYGVAVMPDTGDREAYTYTWGMPVQLTVGEGQGVR
jgi:hypothetical protein